MGWRLEDMGRFTREHGPNSPRTKPQNPRDPWSKQVPNTRFDNLEQIFAEAIQKATWKQEVTDAITRDLEKAAPTESDRTIEIVKTTARDMDERASQSLKWEIKRTTFDRIIISLFHADIKKCGR